MPPATAWGWNPQLLAAGSAYAQGYGGQAAAFTYLGSIHGLLEWIDRPDVGDACEIYRVLR